MKKVLLATITLITLTVSAQKNNYQNAWAAINENKWDEASQLIDQAKKDPATFQDAYITKMYLESYKGNEQATKDFNKAFYSVVPDSYPYIYALWFNEGVAGNYGKKIYDNQLDLLNKLVDDSKAPGTLINAADYQLGCHYLSSNNFNKADKYYNSVGNIRNWQYTGPFENISQSGYYKDFGPLGHPEPGATFKSSNNADIKWFVPAAENNDGWTPLSYQFDKRTAVEYAQNFVNSPSDQQVYLCVGASGSVKVWINDELVIAESKERITEMDTYIVKCNLKKGVNRVLVQLGFTNLNNPNFIVRFTDENLRSLLDIKGSSVYSAYPKATDPGKKYTSLTPFAESYFLGRIKAAPDNLVNYLLLADVYLRNTKVNEARNTINDALKKAPDNCLLRMKMTEVLLKEGNRTVLLEEVEKIKKLDPNSLIVLELKIKEDIKNQKYDEASDVLDKRISLYGEDENTADYKLSLLAQEKKYDDLVKEVERLYVKYPANPGVLSLMYAVKKEVYKDTKAAMKLYETYMKDNYDYNVYTKYADLLSEQGDDKKALDVKKKIAEQFPYSPAGYYDLSKYYYSSKDYNKAVDYAEKALALAPYVETYWEQLGDIKSEVKDTDGALEAYNKSLNYDPKQYLIINKIRKLGDKQEMNKYLPDVDIDALVQSDNIDDAKNTDYGYYYILDQKGIILYPGGAAEEYYTTLIRITNEKGVDKFKESSIGYNNSQTLLIEKAEVIKKSNAKIEGEKNDNDIVFTNLEPGDVIVFKYRLRSYSNGRLSKEFWDKYHFGGQIYTVATRYSLLAPANQKIYYIYKNGTLEPAIKDVENYKQYTWELKKAVPDKDEPLSPLNVDVVGVLHISTIASWNEIADWYSDISNTKAEEDFDIISLYKELFDDHTKNLSQFQKAKIIYEYIESNIRYSSVSFRQSSFVPQRPSVTLSTRLGDCKDLSSLFVTLANMAGIKAQMVLVDTRDNGQYDIILPGVEFNHCIVKAEMDGKKYYIEMTDNYLPFTSLPNDLVGAAILEIPYKSKEIKSDLNFLKPENKTNDVIKRVVDMKPVDDDLEVYVKTTKIGAPSAGVRASYENLDIDKQKKNMEESVAGSYKNNVKLLDVKFNDLDKLDDSVVYAYSYKVKNEISEIGSMKTFRIVYPDVVASLDNFSAETRTLPINYWSYEDADRYETTVNIKAPAGTKFIELPASETLSFKNLKFSIQYILKAPDKLTIVRKFTSDRQNIPASDYAAFKAFFEKVIKAEQKFITFK